MVTGKTVSLGVSIVCVHLNALISGRCCGGMGNKWLAQGESQHAARVGMERRQRQQCGMVEQTSGRHSEVHGVMECIYLHYMMVPLHALLALPFTISNGDSNLSDNYVTQVHFCDACSHAVVQVGSKTSQNLIQLKFTDKLP